MGSPVSLVIANIYMEYFESLAIPTSPTLIKWWFRNIDDVCSATRKDQVNKLQEQLNSIGPHIKFTIELPGTDGLPFLDTLTKPTPYSIESTVYRKTSHKDRYLSILTIPFQQNYLLSTPSSTELNKYVLHLNSLQKKWITFIKSYKTTTTQHSSFNKANPNRKPTKSQTHPQESLWKELGVVKPHIKGLGEQFRHTLAKYKVRVFFKCTSTIKSLLTHPKDQIPDAQQNWYILPLEMPSQQLYSWIHRQKKESQTTEIKPPVPSETTPSPQNIQKQN